MTYPPEPWYLEGRLYLSVWLTPRRAAADALPPGVRPVTLAGRALVGTAWAVYEGDGVLRYREVLRAVLARRRCRPLATITGIWVDSEESRAGGRALWGVPKEPAVFTVTGRDRFSARARAAHGQECAARFRALTRISLPLPVAFRVAQIRAGRLHITPVRGRGRVRPARASWDLGALGQGGGPRRPRPLLSLLYEDARMLFGDAPRPPGPGSRARRDG
ncbi:acetoacetate decarboxylase family protein [Streptomyces cyaneogriseus]|uniref:acetoacetate decarboxylase family protein n=1 Tax=Streptomyces cyaneogriseus TaxID=68192 RepID=UPI0005C8BB3B|nr:acetoacetate decarboxylase family protein [Streptomyces cyaneogriseus]